MSTPCVEIRSELIADRAGALGPLAHRRIDSHLARCAACRETARRLDAALTAAAAWTPEVDEARLEGLMSGLAPLAPPARLGLRLGTWLVAAAAVALVVGAGLAARRFGPGVETLAVAVPADVREAPDPPPALPSLSAALAPAASPPVSVDSGLVRARPQPRLRWIADRAFDGRLEQPSPTASVVEMTRGFAVFDFEGGEDRSLLVRLGALRVEVIGTRFSVDARGPSPVVAVREGRVRVVDGDRGHDLAAGEAARFTAEGSAPVDLSATPAGLLGADPFLDRVPARRRAARVGSTPPLAEPPAVSWLSALGRAESLARAGDRDAAREAYAAIARAAAEPAASAARLELVRLELDDASDPSEALARLDALSERVDEVGAQARLLRCEHANRRAPCEARTCLERLAERPRSGVEARREAARWAERWRLAERCPRIMP